MSLCVDVAWDKPSGAALKAAGVVVASLYVGQDDTGKNMTPAVVQDYLGHGVAVLTNFEYGAAQMLGGASQGVVDARLGLSQKRACGIPDTRPIIYSADWAATATQITDCVIPYLIGARGVTGPGTVGVYGSYYVVKAVADYWAAHFPGEKIWLWQTVAWSNGLIDSRIDFYQNGTTVTISGIACDVDEIRHADAGQHPVPATAPLIPLEDDMAYIISLPAPPPGQSDKWFVVDPPFITAIPTADGGALGGKLGSPVPVSMDYYNRLLAEQAKLLPGAATVNLDLTDAQATALGQGVAGGVEAALDDPAHLAAEGAAIAHAEAVQQHNDTPAS